MSKFSYTNKLELTIFSFVKYLFSFVSCVKEIDNQTINRYFTKENRYFTKEKIVNSNLLVYENFDTYISFFAGDSNKDKNSRYNSPTIVFLYKDMDTKQIDLVKYKNGDYKDKHLIVLVCEKDLKSKFAINSIVNQQYPTYNGLSLSMDFKNYVTLVSRDVQQYVIDNYDEAYTVIKDGVNENTVFLPFDESVSDTEVVLLWLQYQFGLIN